MDTDITSLQIASQTKLGAPDPKVAELVERATTDGKPLQVIIIGRFYRGGQRYTNWPAFNWRVWFGQPSPAALQLFRDALAAFFAAAATGRLGDLTQHLDDFTRGAK